MELYAFTNFYIHLPNPTILGRTIFNLISWTFNIKKSLKIFISTGIMYIICLPQNKNAGAIVFLSSDSLSTPNPLHILKFCVLSLTLHYFPHCQEFFFIIEKEMHLPFVTLKVFILLNSLDNFPWSTIHWLQLMLECLIATSCIYHYLPEFNSKIYTCVTNLPSEDSKLQVSCVQRACNSLWFF